MRRFFLIEDPNDLSEPYAIVYHNSRTNRTVFVSEWCHTIQEICNQASKFTFDTRDKIDLDDYLKQLKNGDNYIVIQLPCLPYPGMEQDYPELFI